VSPTAAPPRRRPPRPTAPAAPAPRRRPAPPVRGAVVPPRTRPRPTTRDPGPAPKRRAARVVPPPTPSTRRPRLRATVVVLAVASVVVTIAGFHAFLAQTQVRLEDLRSQIDRAEARYESLRLENGRLSSPARITARAEELGLGPPEVAPVAIAMTGTVPKRGGSSETLSDWVEVKHHLDASP